MGIDKKSIKKMFPNLIRELEGSENKVRIDSVRADAEKAEADVEGDVDLSADAATLLPDKFRHYNPTIEDFIRRCDNEVQAEEIVAYLLKRGEMTEEEAAKVRAQLKEAGVRSFGPKKEENYYFKHGGIC